MGGRRARESGRLTAWTATSPRRPPGSCCSRPLRHRHARVAVPSRRRCARRSAGPARTRHAPAVEPGPRGGSGGVARADHGGVRATDGGGLPAQRPGRGDVGGLGRNGRPAAGARPRSALPRGPGGLRARDAGPVAVPRSAWAAARSAVCWRRCRTRSWAIPTRAGSEGCVPRWPNCSPGGGVWWPTRSGSWWSPGWPRRRRCWVSRCAREGCGPWVWRTRAAPSTTRCTPRPGSPPCRCPWTAKGIALEPLRASGVRTVVTTPAHQFPTGIAYSPRRRAELLDWGRSMDGIAGP
ncbi:hypothetical protein SVIOM74S_05749 [Streptomyces violarus]